MMMTWSSGGREVVEGFKVHFEIETSRLVDGSEVRSKGERTAQGQM